jgi:hypothetical protein
MTMSIFPPTDPRRDYEVPGLSRGELASSEKEVKALNVGIRQYTSPAGLWIAAVIVIIHGSEELATCTPCLELSRDEVCGEDCGVGEGEVEDEGGRRANRNVPAMIWIARKTSSWMDDKGSIIIGTVVSFYYFFC